MVSRQDFEHKMKKLAPEAYNAVFASIDALLE
jgi:hypothetical protein